MNSCIYKSLKIILFIFSVTIFLNSSLIWCKQNDLIEWNECTKLLVKLRRCSGKLHLPKNCTNIQKSDLLQCAENVTKEIHLCKDDIGVRLIKNYITIYRVSDKVLCLKSIYARFSRDSQCGFIAKFLAIQISALAPGLLTEKGCRVYKSAMYVQVLAQIKRGCYDLLSIYIEALYQETSCRDVHVDPPTYKDLKDVKEIVSHLITCWMSHRELPTCKTAFSNRLRCVKSVNMTGMNENLSPIVHNFIDITRETDKVICNSQTLRKDFQEHRNCWTYVQLIGFLVLDQANGLLTKDGCRAIKYKENMTMAYINPGCARLTLDYRAQMEKFLPCVPDTPAPTPAFAIALNADNFVSVYLLSLTITIKLLFLS